MPTPNSVLGGMPNVPVLRNKMIEAIAMYVASCNIDNFEHPEINGAFEDFNSGIPNVNHFVAVNLEEISDEVKRLQKDFSDRQIARNGWGAPCKK